MIKLREKNMRRGAGRYIAETDTPIRLKVLSAIAFILAAGVIVTVVYMGIKG